MNRAIEKKMVVDFQWNDDIDPNSDLYQEVRKLWQYYNFGNDNYYYKWDFETDEKSWPLIAKYLKTLPQDNPFLLHWWW